MCPKLPRGNRYLPAAHKLDGNQHQRFSQNLHGQQGCLHSSWKSQRQKCQKQHGQAHLSGLELVWIKAAREELITDNPRPITSGNLEFL
jgi:hypothetical protein